MSPPDIGKPFDAPAATPREGLTEEQSQTRAVQAEARNSLFMDSIDAKFRPAPLDIGADHSLTTPRSLDAGAPLGPTTDVPLYHYGVRNGSLAPLPGSLFNDPGAERSNDNYFYRRPNDLPYADRRLDSLGYGPNDLFHQRDQKFADRAADMIFPGFGRFEGKSADQDWRVDYLYARNCRIKGLGLCFTINLH